jgi:hypothetical protein
MAFPVARIDSNVPKRARLMYVLRGTTIGEWRFGRCARSRGGRIQRGVPHRSRGCPDANRLGDERQDWRVALTKVNNERASSLEPCFLGAMIDKIAVRRAQPELLSPTPYLLWKLVWRRS